MTQLRRSGASTAGRRGRIALTLGALAVVGAGAWWLARGPAAEVPLPGPQAAASQVVASTPPPDRLAPAKLVETTPIASRPPAASAPPTTVSFETAPDLYHLASDSINSSDPGVLFNGLDAVRSCRATLKTRGQYEQLAAGPQTRQALAAKELLQRCGGFFNNDHAAITGLLQRYLQKLKGHEGRYLHRATSQTPLGERFAALLATQDWQMFVASMSEVMPGTLKAQGIAMDSEQAMFFGVAWLQVTCDLGQDCSGRNILYVARCADHGRCPGSAEAEMSDEMNESQRAAVRQFREKLAAAVRARDLGFFGLRRVS